MQRVAQRFRSRRLRALEAKNGGAMSHDDAQKQQEKQLRLRLRQKEEALAKLAKEGHANDSDKEEEVDMPIEAYTGCVAAVVSCLAHCCSLPSPAVVRRPPTAPRPHKYPPGVDTCRIRVDRDHEAVLVPVCGMIVPFHISCIKSVSITVDRTAAFLRLNFYHTGGAFGREASPSIVKACASMPNLMYIKTLSFKSKVRHRRRTTGPCRACVGRAVADAVCHAPVCAEHAQPEPAGAADQGHAEAGTRAHA